MKLCINCRHHEEFVELFSICNATESKRIDPVRGEEKRRDCDTMRLFSSLCGEDARYFEAKEGVSK
jgi:hypothetical protein